MAKKGDKPIITDMPEDPMKLAAEIASDMSDYSMALATMIATLHQSSEKMSLAIAGFDRREETEIIDDREVEQETL